VQLSLVGLCLISAWLCGRLGLSEELGAFIAGTLTVCVARCISVYNPRCVLCIAIGIAGAMMSVAERKLVAAGLLVPSHGICNCM
jgi:hypothetical protein